MKRIMLMMLCAIIAGITVAASVKSLLGANGAEYMDESKAEYTAKDYIQDGLVAMWDGIENAGWGVHDPNATTWKDLVGSCDLSRNGTPLVKPNCMGFDGSCCFYGASQFGTICTMEAVVDAKTQVGSTDPELVRLDGTRQYKIYINNNRLTLGISMVAAGAYAGYINTGIEVVAWVFDTSQQLFYVNGAYRSSRAWKYPQTGSGVVIGAGSSSLFRPGVGDVYSVRLYSRTLTSQEIAANYAIDKARFNLP